MDYRDLLHELCVAKNALRDIKWSANGAGLIGFCEETGRSYSPITLLYHYRTGGSDFCEREDWERALPATGVPVELGRFIERIARKNTTNPEEESVWKQMEFILCA